MSNKNEGGGSHNVMHYAQWMQKYAVRDNISITRRWCRDHAIGERRQCNAHHEALCPSIWDTTVLAAEKVVQTDGQKMLIIKSRLFLTENQMWLDWLNMCRHLQYVVLCKCSAFANFQFRCKKIYDLDNLRQSLDVEFRVS